jgi:hypothetical protein
MKFEITQQVKQRTIEAIDWLESKRLALLNAKKERQLIGESLGAELIDQYYKDEHLNHLKAHIEYSHLLILYFGDYYFDKTRYEGNIYYFN